VTFALLALRQQVPNCQTSLCIVAINAPLGA
jgi:hypothetical protein